VQLPLLAFIEIIRKRHCIAFIWRFV